MTAHELQQALLAGIDGARWDALAALYTEDAEAEQPMAPGGPRRLVGRAAVAETFAAAATLPLELRVGDLVVHPTGDPDVTVSEFSYRARNTATGATAVIANVQVLQARDGRIARTRDYHDHLMLAAVAGGRAAAAAASDAAIGALGLSPA